MQPNKSLVFYLANEDTGDVNVPEKQLLASYQEEWDAQAKNTMSLSQERAVESPAPIETEAKPTTEKSTELDDAEASDVFDSQLFFTQHLKDAILEPNAGLDLGVDDLEDDWIAGLEQLRNQRRYHKEDRLTPIAELAKPQVTQFAQVEHSALSGVLKVTSVKATHLYQPAAKAIAAGKDLDSVTLHMQEATNKAKKTVTKPIQDADVKEIVTKAIVDKLLLPENEEILPKVEDAAVFVAVQEAAKANVPLLTLVNIAETETAETETAETETAETETAETETAETETAETETAETETAETEIAETETAEAEAAETETAEVSKSTQTSNEMVFASIQEVTDDLNQLVLETLAQSNEAAVDVVVTAAPLIESKDVPAALSASKPKAKPQTQPLIKLLVDIEEVAQPLVEQEHHLIEPTAAPVRTDSLLLDESAGLSLQMQMKQLKEAAKNVPIDPWYVEPAPLTPKAMKHEPTETDEIDPALLAKAEEVAQKTALTPEEKVTLLDGFLSLWQDRQTSKHTKASKAHIVFKEDWQQHNESILQSDVAGANTETVMWLKTQPEAVEGDEAAVTVVPEIVTQPDALAHNAMYAPIHVHLHMPVEEDDAVISVISEADLLSQLTERLQPYFVDMLTGLVKTELTKQTHFLVQRLQENLAAEIPTMVDELLQENLSKALNDIKKQSA
ncbi:hypothetical protein ADP71_12500 [Vitreoscilla sp. C1]|uniref:hypothetical protein n=1 Tax=Vitreoscilla sp. (strain C1) TaxID=96942 RepID=UPI00148ECF07|nr:hypothetical protein [Vitreoscilla sp. C1]AUZ04888.2 hypothetical protein ADP71_12500 [Vitreoscilla sp. C1]